MLTFDDNHDSLDIAKVGGITGMHKSDQLDTSAPPVMALPRTITVKNMNLTCVTNLTIKITPHDSSCTQ